LVAILLLVVAACAVIYIIRRKRLQHQEKHSKTVVEVRVKLKIEHAIKLEAVQKKSRNWKHNPIEKD